MFPAISLNSVVKFVICRHTPVNVTLACVCGNKVCICYTNGLTLIPETLTFKPFKLKKIFLVEAVSQFED